MQLQNAIAPAAAQAPAQTPQQDAGFESRVQAWMQHLSSAETRAALMQFGVSMLQPRGNNTFAGHVGASIGDAGGAAARVTEARRLKMKDAREERRLDNAEAQTAETQRINREELALAKRSADRADATAAAQGAQQAVDNKFKEQELALKKQSVDSLNAYHQGVLARGQSPSKTVPAGYNEALDVAKAQAEFAEDPLASYFAAKAQIDAEFGLTAGGPGATPTASTASAPAAPKAGDVIDGWKFKGGDPSQQSSWEKVK